MADFGRILRPRVGLNPPGVLASSSSTHNAPFRLIRPPVYPLSDYITTRCYNSSGRQIWHSDHGTTVHALAVNQYGTVFQSGYTAGALAGDSPFHKSATQAPPYVSAMYHDGRPMWALLNTAGYDSSGIAATSDGFLYVGLFQSIGDPDNRIAKLEQSLGEEILRLPVAGFNHTQSGERWRRVKVDSSNNVYSGTRNGYLVKWVNDVEFWNQPTPGTSGYIYTGLGVASDGRLFTSSHPLDTVPGPIAPLLLAYNTSVSNLAAGPTGSYSFRVIRPDPAFTEPDFEVWDLVGWLGMGVSPSGRAIVHGHRLSNFFDPVAIQEITASADPDNPTQTVRVEVPLLGGSFGFNETAISINDSGVICYSVDRGTTSPVASHEIRAADNSLIGTYDHGGAINDCVVLPDGKVIVAGERVLRADYPGI